MTGTRRPARLKKVPTNRGGRALLAHIRSTGDSIPVWCEKHGFDRIRIQNAINKGSPRHNIPFAIEIRNATNGEVESDWWAEELPAEPSTGTHGGGE